MVERKKYKSLGIAFNTSMLAMVGGCTSAIVDSARTTADHTIGNIGMAAFGLGVVGVIVCYVIGLYLLNRHGSAVDIAKFRQAQADSGASGMAAQLQNIIQAQSNRIIAGSDPIDIFKK